MMEVGLNLLKFFEDESCGQCTPCRVGTEKTVKLMQNNVLGHSETHRIVFELYPSHMTWAMGKPKKIIG